MIIQLKNGSPACGLELAGTAGLWRLVGLITQIYTFRYVLIQVLFFFASQCVFGDGLKRLLNVDGLFGARLKIWHVVLLLTPLHSSLSGHCSAVGHVHLVADDDEWKVFGVSRRRLYKKLVAPALQIFERGRRCHVIDEHAAVRSAIKSDAQTLKSLLAGRIPDLHGDEAIVDHHLLGEKVSANRGFVLVVEFFVYILIHQGGFSHTLFVLKKNLFS